MTTETTENRQVRKLKIRANLPIENMKSKNQNRTGRVDTFGLFTTPDQSGEATLGSDEQRSCDRLLLGIPS